MSKIRVLIVDDSVVIRRCLSTYISSDPSIEVIGTAADGEIGLAKIASLNPDLVILDIEMPVMDGLQTLAAIRRRYEKLPVIMFSTLTERGAVATLNALSLGASDYATKSINGGTARQHICSDLVPKIKALCRNIISRHAPSLEQRTFAPTVTPPRLGTSHIDVVAIGASTGGPNALATLVVGLSRALPVPILIVQHMPQLFTRLLAERLAALSGFEVNEGRPGELIHPRGIWIAPGGYHMDLTKTPEGARIRTHKGEPENSCRPAVDVLFRSVAQIYGPRALGVILTGMGQDGLLGCQSVCDAGGQVLAQDEASSVVWGMPGAVTNAGIPTKVLPLGEIAGEINRMVARRPVVREKPRPALADACAIPHPMEVM